MACARIAGHRTLVSTMNDLSGIRYLFDTPPAPGELREVVPGVRWLRVPLPFALDHINLWVLDDGPGVAIVDCGIGDRATRDLWTQVFEGPLKGRPVTRLIVTHFHPDHIGNAAWLCDRFGVLMHISQAEYLMAHATADNAAGYSDEATLDFFRQHGLDDSRREALLKARGGGYQRLVPELPTHYHRIGQGDQLRLGESAWQVIDGHGHSPEHAALHRMADRVLISGDMVLPRISTNVSVHATQPDSDPLGDFLGSLERYRALDPDTLVLPSHGLPFRGLHARIDALRAHHDERLAELVAVCDEPRLAAEVMTTLFRRPLDGYQIWFAMGETLAHLNRLVRQGRLACDRGADGCLRYRQPVRPSSPSVD
jgi:glyoxylase-like metal-dependent hydrolase (beta-lactamase superfamily II)